MKKWPSAVMGVLFLLVCASAPAATPFPAPATFNLEGSSITLSVALTTRITTVSMAPNPNPAPVTGSIAINQLNQVSGEFTGAFNGVSASATATAPSVGVSVPVTVSLDSDTVTGVFAWAKDKVVFDLSQLTATLTVGNVSYPIPLYGIFVPASYSDGVLRLQAQLSQSGEYMGYPFSIQAAIDLVGRLQPSAGEALWIALQTDRPTYKIGDNVKVSAAGGNTGAAPAVDLYLALCAPDGACYFAPSYTPAPAPLIAGWQPDDQFYLPPTLVYDIGTPAALPPIGATGGYQFLAGFCRAGTYELVGEISAAPFTLTQSAPQSFDGIWRGSAVSLVNTADCAGFADVRFDVTDGRIGGEANEVKEFDADGYLVSGTVAPDGTIVEGTILEEFALNLVPVGFFAGNFAGNSVSGTWQDVYGCYGTFALSPSDN